MMDATNKPRTSTSKRQRTPPHVEKDIITDQPHARLCH